MRKHQCLKVIVEALVLLNKQSVDRQRVKEEDGEKSEEQKNEQAFHCYGL